MKLKTRLVTKAFLFFLLFLPSCSSLDDNLVKLKSTDSEKRLEAIDWLYHNVPNETTSKLIEEALANDSSPVIRSFAIRLMVLSNNKKYLPLVVEALNDKDYIVRMEAAQSIGSFHAFEMAKLLGEKLEIEEHPWVKLKIIKSLRYLKAKKVVMPLIKVLSDENSAVRLQALTTLEVFTKQNFGLKSESWENWYKNQKGENLK